MYHRIAVALGAALWLAASGLSAADVPPRVTEDAIVPWRSAAGGFGSFSGLTVSADGRKFVAVSDKGNFVTGNLIRENGRLTGVERTASGPLLDPRGNPVRRFDVDAEGVTVGADGRLYVSFEANHRVWAYTALDKPADPLPQPAAFRALQNNSGLEALFTGPDGALYAIPERSGALDRPFPVYRYGSGNWNVAFSIPRRPPHLVTGADLGPDGRLYLVERHWNGLLGFSTRIRSFGITSGGVYDERILLESRIGAYDNLEGIAVWRDPQRRIRLLLVSDDNESFFQRTELVEFILNEEAPRRPFPRPE